jgi:hypothetical protein
MEATILSEIAVEFCQILRIYSPKICNISICAQILVPLTPSILSVLIFSHFLFPFHHISVTRQNASDKHV